MKISWFREYLADAVPIALKNHSTLEQCAKKIHDISKYNAGQVIPDEETDAEQERQFALSRFEETLLRYVLTRTASSFHNRHVEYYYSYSNSPEGLIRPATLSKKYDINVADQDALESLPGIGRILAERIVSHRKSLGSFTDIRQLLSISGMTEAAFNRFAFMITTESPERSGIVTPALIAFIKAPTIANFLGFLEQSGGGFINDMLLLPKASPIDHLLAELEILEKEVLTELLPYRLALPATRASHLKQEQECFKQVERIDNLAVTPEGLSGLLFDSEYLAFLHEIIDSAKKSIDIAMFFMAMGENPNHPTRGLLDKLVKAKNRQVKIRVFLDKDKEGDIYLSREINKAAFEYLENAGIEVKFDSEEVLLHSKLVVIDSEVVIIGSHNWTAGSFYQYDDVSCYVVSKELGNYYRKWFDNYF